MSSSDQTLNIDFHEIITSSTLEDTKGLTSNFYNGYQDYYNILKSVEENPYLDQNGTQLTDDDQRFFWLQNAIEINSNNAVMNPDDPGGLSNTYIRDVTRSGLLYDGQATASDVDQKVQTNSDTIGKYVLGSLYGFTGGLIPPSPDGKTVPYDYTKIGKVPGINDFIKDDIRSALDKGGQTEATWGGSFFFWNVSLDGATVGQIIQSNPNYYEEFLATNAKSAADTSSSPASSLFVEIATALKAQAPLSVESAIYGRMLYGERTGNWNGDPNEVDGYSASFDDKGNFVGWQLPTADGLVDIGDVPSLDAIRNIRLSAPTDWYGGAPVHNRMQTLVSGPAFANDAPGVLDPVGTDENNSVTIAIPSGTAGGQLTVVSSGDHAPVALGGTVAVVDGNLVYTPDQDVVGQDYVQFETSDGNTTSDWVVPVTISGVAHDTTTTAADGSMTVVHFGDDGLATSARTDRPDGGYTLSYYAEAAGTSYVAVADDFDQSGTLLAETKLQPDGTTASRTTFATADDGSSTTSTYDGQGTLLSSVIVHVDGTKDVMAYLQFSDASQDRTVDTAYDAQGDLVGQTFTTPYGWTYAAGSAVQNADGSYSETMTDDSGVVLEQDTFYADGSRDAVTPDAGELWSSVDTRYGADGRVAARQLLRADGSTLLAGTATYDLFGDTTITYAPDADGMSAMQTIAEDGSSELMVSGIVGQAYATLDLHYNDAGMLVSQVLGYGDGSADTQTFERDWSGHPYLAAVEHTDSTGLETSKTLYGTDGSVIESETTVKGDDGTLTTTERDGSGSVFETVTRTGAVTRYVDAASGTAYVDIASGGSYATQGDESYITMADGVTLQASASGITIESDGSGDNVDIAGTGDVYRGDGNSLHLEPGASATVVGGGNDIEVGPGSLTLVGSENVVHFDGASIAGGQAPAIMSAKSPTNPYPSPVGDVLDVVGVDPANATFSHVGTDLVITLAQGGTIDVVDQFGPDKLSDGLTFADGTTWDAGQMATAAGYAVQPGLYYGSSQEDDISPGLVNTTFDLGRGDDRYYDDVNTGNNFIYASGDGNDIYSVTGQGPTTDTLTLTDLRPEDVSLARSGSDLLVTDTKTDQTIDFAYQFYYNGSSGIAGLTFADGTTWDRDQIQANAAIRGTDGNDTFNYVNYTDSIIDLGKGDDNYGEYSAQGDIFVYRSGDGSDVYSLVSPAVDNNVLKLVDLHPADVSLLATGRADTDLLVTDRATGQTVTLVGEFDDQVYGTGVDGVSNVEFADGTSWNRSDMAANASSADQIVSADDASVDLTSNATTVLVTGARDRINMDTSGAAVKVQGPDATLSGSYGTIDFLNGGAGSVVGDGDLVRLGSNTVATVSGNYDQVDWAGQNGRLSANGAYVTAQEGATGTISGDGNYLVVRGETSLDVEGNVDNTTVTGDGNTLTLGGSGHNVYVAGSGNTLALDSDAHITSSGADTTFVFTPQSGASSITGMDDSDSLQFQGTQIDSWQAFLDRSVQQGSDTVTQLDETHSITFVGVALTSLDKNKVIFS